MFYLSEHDQYYRFGDVIRGFVSVTPNLDEPILKRTIPPYLVEVDFPAHCVVLSPCCSIGDKMISLTPLIKVRNTFFNNSYLAEDLTRINRVMKPEQSVPDGAWDRMLQEERLKRMASGEAYSFVELFVYEEHELLPKYSVNMKGKPNIETGCYMIDFRNIFKVQCKKIIKSEQAPIEAKVLQLSIGARSELRDKLSFYFGRTPEEDVI
jgi:hypothetical protein